MVLLVPAVRHKRLAGRVGSLQLGQPGPVGLVSYGGLDNTARQVPRLGGDPLGGQEDGHEGRVDMRVDEAG